MTCAPSPDEWAALGTWVTGLAAAGIAVIAHHAARAADNRAGARDRRNARAFAILAIVEVHARESRARIVRQHLESFVSQQSPLTLAVAKAALNAPNFKMSDWLATSPSIGDLPEDAAARLAGVIASSAQVADGIDQAVAALSLPQITGAAVSTVEQTIGGLTTFETQLAQLLPILDPIARQSSRPGRIG
jgi:hypothetical protein